jgi:hypothetical protein
MTTTGSGMKAPAADVSWAPGRHSAGTAQIPAGAQAPPARGMASASYACTMPGSPPSVAELPDSQRTRPPRGHSGRHGCSRHAGEHRRGGDDSGRDRYARATVIESRKATAAAEKTVRKAGEIVGAVRDLLEVAWETASSSSAAAEASGQAVEAGLELVRVTRETVELAKAAREAEERALLERRLRDIGELVERAFAKAAAEDGARPMAGWRCVEQQYIEVALVGVGVELPECHTLAGSSQAGSVLADPVDARREIAEQLPKLPCRRERLS